jgi:hypothetical protein
MTLRMEMHICSKNIVTIIFLPTIIQPLNLHFYSPHQNSLFFLSIKFQYSLLKFFLTTLIVIHQPMTTRFLEKS